MAVLSDSINLSCGSALIEIGIRSARLDDSVIED